LIQTVSATAEGLVMTHMGDKRYRRIVWVVRLLNLLLLTGSAVIFLADLSLGAFVALGIAWVAMGWAGLGYLLLALRRLRRETGEPDGLWVVAELRQFQKDVLFDWR
jgi:hypothetical protein